jgi:hypothetical protein
MRERALESNQQQATGRGAQQSAPRPTPLTLVSGAVAGDDLATVTGTVAQALGRAVAIAIPELGPPLVRPEGALGDERLTAISNHGAAVARGEPSPPPAASAESVPVRIGAQVVGVIVLTDFASATAGRELLSAGERRAWLEAAAAAASIAALIRDARDPFSADAGAELLLELASGPPEDPAAFLLRARRAGIELGAGAIALAARADGTHIAALPSLALTGEGSALTAHSPGGRLLALVPAGARDTVAELATALREQGLVVATSASRRDSGSLYEALREVELLVELAVTPEAALEAQEETYRLLIGVLLRDPDELNRLRAATIAPLADYDTRHDTDLLVTLQAFLGHDGSTMETAEAMRLHRHTVGYRLSRVHEVSGLSPYESDGRERLSLGLKAQQILLASQRLDRTSLDR